MGCTIIGCGKQLPALDVPNEELTKLVDTSDEWISSRTGILSRRVCVGEGNVDLAEGAARQALGWADKRQLKRYKVRTLRAERRFGTGHCRKGNCESDRNDLKCSHDAAL